MALPVLNISLDFSSGATFGNPLILGSGIIGVNILGDSSTPALIVDLTDSTRNISIRRGRNVNRDTYEAGTCTVRIFDPNSDFNPQNPASPYYGYLTPLRKLRISATYLGTEYFLFSGYTTDYIYTYDQAENISYVDISASDAFRLLNLAAITTVAGTSAGQDTGTRLGYILDQVDFPSSMRSIDTGNSTTLADPATSRTTLSAIQNVETSEQGAFYVNPQGNVVFKNRSNTIGSAGGTPIEFNQTTGIPYRNLIFAFDDKLIVNDAKVNKIGGAVQAYSDAASIAAYFPHSVTFSDLVVETDTDAANIAAIYVATRSTTTIRIDQMSIDLYDSLVPIETIMGMDYFTNVKIANIQPNSTTITKNLQIQGINWEITPNSWIGNYTTLEPIVDGFILGSSAYGLLDDDILTYQGDTNMAAGLGFKTFATGDVLTAGDTNGYLMQGVLVFASAAARTSAITSPQEGQMSYLKDTNVTQYYDGSAWTNVGAGGGWTLISTTTLAGATTTLSSIPQTYTNIQMVIQGYTGNTGNAVLRVAPNGTNNATSSNYLEGYGGGGISSSYDQDITYVYPNYNRASLRTNANNVNVITFYNYTSTTGYKPFDSVSYVIGTDSNRYYTVGGGVFANNSAITSLDIQYGGTNTFAGGTVKLFGA